MTSNVYVTTPCGQWREGARHGTWFIFTLLHYHALATTLSVTRHACWSVKCVLKYRRNGCQSAGKQDKEIPQSVLGSRVCAGQRAWLQPGGCALMGCQCPISDGQGWAKAQPECARTGTKRISRNRRFTWVTWYYGWGVLSTTGDYI